MDSSHTPTNRLGAPDPTPRAPVAPSTLPADHPAASPGLVDRFKAGYDAFETAANEWRDKVVPQNVGAFAKPIDRRTVTEQAAAARAQGSRLVDSAASADVSGTQGAQILPSAGGAGTTTAAAMDASKTMANIKATAEAQGRFSPQYWEDIANRGMKLGSALHAQGKHAEADDVLRKAYNAQQLASGAQQADTFGAIALSNMLGMVKDPYAQQRQNMEAMAADPALTFTTEEQQDMLGRNLPEATHRGSDAMKDIVAPLVGMAPTFEVGGFAGRGALGLAGAAAERAGAEGIGTALGRVAGFGGETGATLGPRVPLASSAMVRTRVGEEVAALRAQLPHMVTRGATQGQIIGAIQNYRMARQQGATPEQALEGAVMGAGLNIPFGIAAEVGLGVTGRAFGLGYDPIRRVWTEARDRVRGVDHTEAVTTPQPPTPHVDAERAVEGKLPASDMMPGLHRDIAQSLDELLGKKQGETQRNYEDIFAEPHPNERPAGPEFWNEAVDRGEVLNAGEPGAEPLGPDAPLIERPNDIGGRGGRRTVPPNEPIPSALEAALRRAGVEPAIRPTDESNAHFTMRRAAMDAEEHARLMDEQTRAVAADAQRALDDPNLKLEQAAQARPGEKQGPLTLPQTLARAAREAEEGHPLATEYREAINRYADAAAAVKDAGEGGPNTRTQIALARARASLDAARTKYGKQIGASAVLALAANSSDLDDEEKKWVGLGGVAILGTDVVRLDEAHPLVNRVPFYSRLSKAVEALPKKWEGALPAADWIGKLKGTTTFKKEELALILPALEEAQRNKVKVSRDDMRRIIQERVPQVERRTLQNPPREEMERYNSARHDGEGGDPNRIEPIDEIEGQHEAGEATTEYLAEQIEHRRARITELEGEIEEQTSNAAAQYEAAQEHTASEIRWVENKVEEAGLDSSVLEPALAFMRENWDGDAVTMPWDHTVGRRERGDPIEHAISLIQDDLYQSHAPEDLLRDNGYTVAEEGEQPPEVPEPVHRIVVRHKTDISDANTHNVDPLVHRGPPNTGTRGVSSDYTGRHIHDDGTIEDTWRADTSYRPMSEYIDRIKRLYGEDVEHEVKVLNADEIAEAQKARDEFEPGEEKQWVVRNSEGREIARGDDQYDVMQEAVEDESLEPDVSELMDHVRTGLNDVERAMRAESEAESEHYHLTEGEGHTTEQSEIDELADEARSIENMLEEAQNREGQRALAAPEEAPAEEAPDADAIPDADPATLPEQIVQPEVHGAPKWEGTQMIPGAKNYRELLTVQTNRQGEPYRPAHSYGEYLNLIGHARVGDYEVIPTPDISGAEVKFNPGEHEDIRTTKAHIVEKRKARDKAMAEANAVAEEFEQLPKEKQNDYSVRSKYLDRYNEFNQRAIDQSKREDELAGKLRELQREHLGMEPPDPVSISVMAESQTDHAQQAGKSGIRQPREPKTPEQLAETKAEVERLRAVLDAADLHASEVSEGGLKHRMAFADLTNKMEAVEYQSFLNRFRDLANERNAAERAKRAEAFDRGEEPGPLNSLSTYPPSLHDLQDPQYKPEFDLMAELIPGAGDIIERARTSAIEADAANDAVTLASNAHEGALASYQAEVRGDPLPGDAEKVPPSPFIQGGTTYDPKTKRWDAEGQQAYVLNAAAFLHDLADRGIAHGAFSDSANRIKNASLPFKAAELVYDELTPNAIKRLLASVGFDKVTLDKVYIRGQGHWHFELTREMREAIKRIGFPLLSVLAMSLVPDNAEAQDGKTRGDGSLYATALGGMVAGAALTYLATSRKGRRLLKENELLRAQLLMDDLSGLSNKKAFKRAFDSVNSDEKYHWVAFDGDRFKKLNDGAGHSAGDRAIQHFGKVIRDVAEEMKIPVRGFRTGGDEFAFAAPVEHAAEFRRRVEEQSKYSESGIETRMTGGIGPTYDVADAMLNTTKDENRRNDPTLRRTPLGNATVLYANPVGPALRELARYPSAAALAGVGAIMTQSDDEDIRQTGAPLIGLAALSVIGSRRIAKGKDYLADKLLRQMQRVPVTENTNLAQLFNPDALLHPDVRQAILDYEATRSKGAARAAEFSGKAKELGPQGDRAVSDVIENENWEDVSGMSGKDMTAVLTFAAALEKEYSDLAAEKVQAGVMDQGQLLPGYAGPRKYAFYEAQDVLAEKRGAGSGGGSSRISAQKSRTLDEPIRDAQRTLAEAQQRGDPQEIQDAQDALDQAHAVQMSQRVERGEIRESSYRAAQGIQKGYNDVAAAKLFEQLRAHPGVAHPEWVQAVDELEAAQKMRKAATTPADRKAADDLVRDAKVSIDEITRKFKQKGGDYVSLPDTPGLGKLRGAVVTRDVANSLEGFTSKGLYAKTLRAWKNIKTIFNPGTHAANVISNITFAHMEGLPMWEQPLWLKRAAQDMRKYGPMTRALAENGVLGVNAVNAEGQGSIGRQMKSEEGMAELYQTTRPETRDVFDRVAKNSPREAITPEGARRADRARTAKYVAAGTALGAAKLYDDEDAPESLALGAGLGAAAGLAGARFGKGIARMYGSEDDIFRVAIGMKKLSQGMSLADATNEGRNALGNFRSRSPALNVLRSTVAPFVLYPAKVLPRFGAQVIDHPWRYLSLIALWGGLNEYSQQEEGPVPDIDLPPGQRRLMGYFLPGFTQLPMHGNRGERAATDMGRWTPLSAITTAAPPGSIPAALDENTPDIFRAGGPVVDLASKFGANVNPFTQKQMYKADYPPRENIRHLLNDASGTMLPSALDVHAANIRDDISNRDTDKLKNDALGPTGLRPRFIRPGANARAATFQLQQSLSSMKRDLSNALIANKNPAKVSVIQARYLREVRSALANYRDRLGVEPPPELVQEALRP